MEDQRMIEVVFSEEATYNSFIEWVEGMDNNELSMWLELFNKQELSEADFEVITKKAIELYCLDMEIRAIPAGEDFIEKILSEFTMLFFMYKLQKDGYVKVIGTMGFGSNLPYETTPKGIEYFESRLKNQE